MLNYIGIFGKGGTGVFYYLIWLIAAAAALTVQLTRSVWWLSLITLLGAYVALLILYIAFLFVLSCFVDLEKPAPKHWRSYRRIAEVSLKLLLSVLRVRVHVTGMEKLPKDERFLFTCNHRAIFDPMVGMVVLKDHDVSYISKKENFKIFIGGPLMHASGILSIDRENDRSAVRTIVQAIKYLKENDRSIAIYPEGYTRKDKSVRLQPFRDGSLKIAQKANVPVAVSTVVGTDKIVRNFFRLRHTDVYFDILALISPADYAGENTHALGDAIWQIMDENLQKRDR